MSHSALSLQEEVRQVEEVSPVPGPSAFPVPGLFQPWGKSIVSGPALCYTEITLHGRDPCLAGLCKTLSHVLSLNILHPAY